MMRKVLILIGALIGCFVGSLLGQSDALPKAIAWNATTNNDLAQWNERSKLAAHHITFTENKGQVVNQLNEPQADVLFSGTDGNLVFHLKKTGIAYQLNRVDSWKEEVYRGRKQKQVEKQTIYRLDISWLNTNEQATVLKSKETGTYNNYYLGHCPDGLLNVRSYEEIQYENLYSGIDLKWYTKDGHLKYDYIVEPHANYKQIQFEIKGADNIIINKNGELILKTPLGDIIEQAPLVIQDGRTLKSKWVITKTKDHQKVMVGFDIENINPSKPFVIDPAIRTWGTYYGDGGVDKGSDCTTDINGNVYMSGETTSTTSIATSGSHQVTFAGVTDAFLVKFDALGVRLWSTYYGGANGDFLSSCAVDSIGNVYAVGRTSSVSGISLITSFAGGAFDAFFVKFNALGVRQWSRYYGGTGDDRAHACVVDAIGTFYIVGETASTTGIATAGSHDASHNGASDVFIVKYNSAGARQWGTYYGGTSTDEAYSCALNTNGDIYIVGDTYLSTGTTIATLGSHQPTISSGSEDAFLAKFNSSGVRQWGTYYGGPDIDLGYGCVVDVSDNVYIGGVTASATGISTPGSHTVNYAGGIRDGYLAKFNGLGVRQWGTYYGGTGDDYVYACAIDNLGNVYITGESRSVGLATLGSYQTTNGGLTDAFLSKFNPSGVRQWCTYYGLINLDTGNACAVDLNGNVYLAGETGSNAGVQMATAGSYQPSYGGGSRDAFLVQFFDCTVAPAQPSIISGNTSLCQGAGDAVYSVPLVANASSYTWTLPSGWSGTSTTNSITATIGTTGGTIMVVANNACGSSTAQSLSVTIQSSPTVSSTVSPNSTVCAGTSITLSGTGASTYAWSGGVTNNTSFVPTVSGTYTVTGTDANGCTATATRNITVNSLPTVSSTVSPNSTVCAGTSITLSGTGASTYAWSGGITNNTSFVPTVSGTYTVTGTDGNGCTATATRNITVNSLPTVSSTVSPNSTVCAGTSITLSGTGASTYAWSGGITNNTSFVPTVSGTYTVTGTDANGCTATATRNITVNSLPTVSSTVSPNSTVCAGTSITLSGTGASTYAWSGGITNNTSFVPTVSGTYTVTGTDGNGCTATATRNITVNSLPTVSSTVSPNSTVCAGTSITLSGAGASTYAWSGGVTNNTSFVPTVSGTYTVTGTDGNGCTATATRNITVNSLPTVSSTVSPNSTVCAGTSITLSGTGASTYAWSGGITNNTSFVPTVSGTYTVTGTDGNGCTATASRNITVNSLPTVSSTVSPNSTVCAGTSITLSGTGASTYAWSGGITNNTSFVPTVSGTYTVTGTDGNGCTATATRNITVNSLPTVSSTVSPNSTVCAGTSITLSGTGASTYAWSGGVTNNTSFVPTLSGTYTVTGTDGNGCTATASQNIVVNPLPTVTFSLDIDTVCSTVSTTPLTTVSPSGGVYAGMGVNGNVFDATALSTGTYVITYSYTDGNGCTDSVTQNMFVDICTGMETVESFANILVYPNPVNDLLTIEWSNIHQEDFQLKLVNIAGIVVLDMPISNSVQKTILEVSNLSTGVYFVNIITKEKTMVYKVVKK